MTVDIADLYASGEPISVAGRVRNRPPELPLWAQIDEAAPVPLKVEGDGTFELHLDPLSEGLHRLDLLGGAAAPSLMSDSVEVA